MTGIIHTLSLVVAEGVWSSLAEQMIQDDTLVTLPPSPLTTTPNYSLDKEWSH